VPSLRFACDTYFQTTVESQHVPRTGERVVLNEHGLSVNYRVTEVSWNLALGEDHGHVAIDVERELQNPCTKCHEFRWKLMPVPDDESFSLVEVIVGWECEACNYPLHHDGKARPPPDPNFKPYAGPLP
jgi:hypothetical protein